MNLTTDFQTFEAKSLAPSLAPLDTREALIDEVWRGLRKRPRSLVPWMLYDAEGSRLFECITALPEYYPSRTERGILENYAEAIITATVHDYLRPLRLLELGAGTAAKTGILLKAAARMRNEVTYFPIDVSSDALEAACDSIGRLLPTVQLQPMVANYVTHPPKLASSPLLAQAQGKERFMDHSTFYRTIQIDGLSIFYREAGPKDAPVLLLLHGLPSSSRMFEPLFGRLSDHYHLVAPDYPGFGHSDWPDAKKFAYTFDHLAEIMNHFAEALGLSRYTLYMQDYGGPVGFRMVLAHPERNEALIVQDAVAHNEGLGANWKARRAFWADRTANESALRVNLLSLATTRTRHVGGDPNVERYDPDLWTDEFAFLSQPGQADIQSDLFYDYRTNVEAYPKWQAWMREKQPRLLVLWGKYESSFDPSEPEAYRRDVPNAQVHILDGGHFALDTAADEIAALVRDFAGSSSRGAGRS